MSESAPFRPPRIPKYRRHKTGQAFVQIDRRRYYLGKYGTQESQERYARLIAEHVASRAQPPPAEPEDPPADFSVVELAAGFWDHAQQYYLKHGRPTRTLEQVKLILGRLRTLYGSTPAAEFGPRRLKVFRDTLLQDGRLSRPYVNKLVAGVVRVFKWGVAEELVPPAVHQALSAVEGLRQGRSTAREPVPIHPVQDWVIEATLPYLSLTVADMVRFQRLTGCRPSEVCILRPIDLDRSGPVWTYRPATHKTEHVGRERLIFIGPKAQQILWPYLRRPAAQCCFNPAEVEQKRRALRHAARRTPASCGNRPGSNRKQRPKRTPGPQYSKGAYNRAIARAVRRANKQRTKEGELPLLMVPSWSPNQLRHTRATEIRKQFSLEAAQVVLGHTRADVTEIYAERDHRLAAEVMRRIG